ncbi:Alpha/Beta hydrolase protein [Mycena galopus ATCC 62051]|nr:Alpha/Beta hydrolase protein [Mycena galopus ATCC 62051]
MLDAFKKRGLWNEQYIELVTSEMVSLKLRALSVCAATTLLFATSPVRAQATPIVDLGYAQYQGAVNTDNNIAHFFGIRFAAPPIGDLRFRAPQPPANITGVQLATTQPIACGVTEDCLYLNVYYPSTEGGAPPKNLPTLVWIYGGGYISGQADGYNGEDIIRQSNNGIVVVVIQYRLGLFGFLAGSEVKKDGDLNAGLLDQDFALRWISKFGGDPTKVTIWGESAGAGGAITSSSWLPSQYRFDDPVPELAFNEVSTQTNCATATDSMSCLRALDTAVLKAVNGNISRFKGTIPFPPVVDGVFITQRPTLSLLEGKVNGDAFLGVVNAFEGTGFVDQSISITAANYSLELFPNFGPAQARVVGALYAGLGTDQFQVNAVYGESILICPTYYLLNAFSGRAFKGEFAIPPALHSMDLPYYFPSLSAPPFNNAAFINAFAQSFTSFIINLDPNIKVDPTTITPHWNKFDVGDTEMLFNQTAVDGLPVVQPIETSLGLLERCLFWNSVGSLTAQ